LVPPPKFNLVTYHGILAPATGWKSTIMPFIVADEDPIRHEGCRGGKYPPQGDQMPFCLGHARSCTLACPMKRVWELDILVCDHCGGRMRIIAAIHSPEAIQWILECLGLPTRAPHIYPALPGEEDSPAEQDFMNQ